MFRSSLSCHAASMLQSSSRDHSNPGIPVCMSSAHICSLKLSVDIVYVHHRSRSTSRSHQQWQGAQRSHSGSSSQGTKRRADSDAMLDPPYESKRARVSTPSAPRPQLDANRQKGPTQAEADAAGLTGSELQGTFSCLTPRQVGAYCQA